MFNCSDYVKTNQPINMTDMIERIALDVTGYCLFDSEFNAMNNPNSEFRKISKIILRSTNENTIRRMMKIFDSANVLKKLFDFQDISPKVHNFFFNRLEDTKKLPQCELTTENDFVKLMLNIRNKELADGKDGKILSYLHFIVF